MTDALKNTRDLTQPNECKTPQRAPWKALHLIGQYHFAQSILEYFFQNYLLRCGPDSGMCSVIATLVLGECRASAQDRLFPSSAMPGKKGGHMEP